MYACYVEGSTHVIIPHVRWQMQAYCLASRVRSFPSCTWTDPFLRSSDEEGLLACLLQIAGLFNVSLAARAWVGRQDQLESPRSNEHVHRDRRNATRRLCQARAR